MMADTWIAAWLRVIIGARVEASRQSIDCLKCLCPRSHAGEHHARHDRSFTVSANFVIKTTDKSNFRLSVSRTVARPQLRELSPFLYVDYFGALEEYGNPKLKRTTIYNGDLRFEYFPTPAEVLASACSTSNFMIRSEQITLRTNKGII